MRNRGRKEEGKKEIKVKERPGEKRERETRNPFKRDADEDVFSKLLHATASHIQYHTHTHTAKVKDVISTEINGYECSSSVTGGMKDAFRHPSTFLLTVVASLLPCACPLNLVNIRLTFDPN